MSQQWMQVTTDGAVLPVGDIGGDDQVSEAYGVRFTHVRLPGRVVDVAFFAETDGEVMRVSRMTSHRICTDVEDPGMTEIWADTRLEQIETAADTHQAELRALRLAGAFTAESITWDGDPEFDNPEAESRLTAGVLSIGQQETVEFYQGLNVPASWFVGVPNEEGTVEVIALGEDFAWSLRITTDGDSSVQEAKLGEFSTGINC